MEQKANSKGPVLAAVFGDISIGIVKFIAAALTGSAAMFSEGIHSIVDSGNSVLILHGLHRSEKKPDAHHPFGYGKELYFWTLVVSVSIFALGGGLSIMKGISAIAKPEALTGDPLMNFVILGISAVIEGVTLKIGLKEFNIARGSMRPFEFIRKTKDPSLFTVVLEDTAAELGLLFAFLGVLLHRVTGDPVFDGLASVCIGLLLMFNATVMLSKSKDLLIGEGMLEVEIAAIHELVESDEDVIACGPIMTLYVGPHSLVLTIQAAFGQHLETDEKSNAIGRLKTSIAELYPQAKHISIEPCSVSDCNRSHT